VEQAAAAACGLFLKKQKIKIKIDKRTHAEPLSVYFTTGVFVFWQNL
jgi:hypothetical protein